MKQVNTTTQNNGEMNGRRPTRQIETGYKIGGRTWISRKWNDGSLTREDIKHEIDSYDESLTHETEEELRDQLRQSEAEMAQEMFEDEGGNRTYEECLESCVEIELRHIEAEEMHIERCLETLQWLYDAWTDDLEDEVQFTFVFQSHKAVDEYCRALTNGELWYIG